MLLVKLITPKKTNTLRRFLLFTFSILFITLWEPVFSQDNSPYTRYGLGDIVPSTNINTRALGSISTGYNDFFTINFNNPSSYAFFQAAREAKSKKLNFGRAILDIGLNFDSRTLIEPGNTEKFTANNALFSYIQIGLPLRNNWGLSFGLRPVSRISYRLSQIQRLYDPVSGIPIDSSLTTNEGDGGTYLASVGTGFRFGNLSLGFNGGYMFGKKDYSARRSFINDTVQYTSGNFQTKTTYGNLYFNAGLQYQIKLDSSTFITLGAYGNLKQNLNASQDLIRETYFYDANAGNTRIDSVYQKNNIKGTIEYPASYTAGFTLQRIPQLKKAGWLIGIDFSQSNWKDYRFYGQADSTRNKWEIRVGGEMRPSATAARKGYWGNVAYRAGFFIGDDYIQVKQKLPLFGGTFGLGLPLRNFNRLNNQVSFINLAFEYIKRGNNNNVLKENMFRISAGFALSDLWFIRKKYE
jgi:hypothetical protein